MLENELSGLEFNECMYYNLVLPATPN